jgi:hypothetical protein
VARVVVASVVVARVVGAAVVVVTLASHVQARHPLLFTFSTMFSSAAVGKENVMVRYYNHCHGVKLPTAAVAVVQPVLARLGSGGGGFTLSPGGVSSLLMPSMSAGTHEQKTHQVWMS